MKYIDQSNIIDISIGTQVTWLHTHCIAKMLHFSEASMDNADKYAQHLKKHNTKQSLGMPTSELLTHNRVTKHIYRSGVTKATTPE